jgi:hypothetical protein
MPYRVESIGQDFNAKGLQFLNDKLNAYEAEGWKLVNTFPVTMRSGCLSLTKLQTTFAVFHKD